MRSIRAQAGVVRASAAIALVAAVVVVLIVAASLGRVSDAGAAPSAAQYEYFSFIGSWTATEPDGTTDRLHVRSGWPNAQLDVQYVEESAQLCGGKHLLAKGEGQATGNVLVASLLARCGGQVSGPYQLTWRSLGDGTITDGFLIWHR
jgi:hypothetical protein